MAVLVASQPWAEPSQGREGAGQHIGRQDMDLLSAPETLLPVRCHVDSDMCLLRKLSTFFFFLLFSSPAFENTWACWRKRKITSFVQSECSPSSRGAAKKAYNLPVLQLNCLSPTRDSFLPLIKWPEALAARQILFWDPNFSLCLGGVLFI